MVSIRYHYALRIPGGYRVTKKNLLGPDSSSCPTRVLVDQLADKWAILVLLAVAPGPMRFNALKRMVEGISQKMLGQTLRRLEWNGIVARQAYATMPMTVEYELTELGETLMPVIEGLRSWSMSNIGIVTQARSRFETKQGDLRSSGSADQSESLHNI